MQVIIDDGTVLNRKKKTTFDILFDGALAPGGIYFLEGLQYGRHRGHQRLKNYDNYRESFSDVIQSWIEQLLIPLHYIPG